VAPHGVAGIAVIRAELGRTRQQRRASGQMAQPVEARVLQSRVRHKSTARQHHPIAKSPVWTFALWVAVLVESASC